MTTTLAAQFAAAIEQKFAEANASKSYDPGYTFSVEPGAVYTRIVETDKHGSRSVHAFVVNATGGLVKSAGWKAPQKEKGGLAVRYDLTTEFDLAVADADPYGSYLYKGARQALAKKREAAEAAA
jgi:hypothetical protein